MKEGWQFVLNETSLHFLLGLRAPGRAQLIKALDALASNPLQSGDFEGIDETGRKIQIKVHGAFLVSYWPDFLVKELRVIKIERL